MAGKEKPTLEAFVEQWWKDHPNFGNPELRENGQFDEIPYLEYEELYGSEDEQNV